MAADNLILKAGTWHARYVIPADLREYFGKSQFSQSLKTGSKAEAQNLKIPLIKRWKTEIQAKRKTQRAEYGDFRLNMDFEEVKEVAVTYMAAKAERETEHIKSLINDLIGKGSSFGEPELDRLKAEQKEHIMHLHMQGYISDAEYDHFGDEIDVWNVQYSMKLNERGQLGFETIVEAVKKLNRITNTLELKMLMGELSETDEFTITEKQEVVESAKNHESHSPDTPFTKKNLETFATYQKDIRKVIDKTVDMQVSRLDKLSDWLKKEKLGLDHKSVRLYLEAQTDLSPKTKKQYVLAGNTFYKWAMNNLPRFESKFQNMKPPFQNHEFPSSRKGKAQAEAERKNYTVKQAEQIFSKAKEIKGKNRQHLMDAIRIGAFTGMRIEEICQLEFHRDLVDDEGVYCISLDDGKTRSSVRKVPVHPDLLPIIERMKKNSKDGFLVPSPAGNKYGIRSDFLSKAFGRLKTSMGFNEQYVFHSFRGTVITQLQRAGVPELTIKCIVGHETGEVTWDIYSDGASPAQKFDGIKKLKYDFAD
ncbi:site-specific integrase [Pseudomonas syringae]|uniref:site-specific integrase n=1 Tax=Pseudomonas syringae TaxID=317 RepID=UPI00041343E3|nr:site-specific integrase [Pseudomonas syringae]